LKFNLGGFGSSSGNNAGIAAVPIEKDTPTKKPKKQNLMCSIIGFAFLE
jgi:hypothetical protein